MKNESECERWRRGVRKVFLCWSATTFMSSKFSNETAALPCRPAYRDMFYYISCMSRQAENKAAEHLNHWTFAGQWPKLFFFFKLIFRISAVLTPNGASSGNPQRCRPSWKVQCTVMTESSLDWLLRICDTVISSGTGSYAFITASTPRHAYKLRLYIYVCKWLVVWMKE